MPYPTVVTPSHANSYRHLNGQSDTYRAALAETLVEEPIILFYPADPIKSSPKSH